MTHRDAIATLLAPEADAPPPSAEARAAAVAHLVDCSDCWATVSAVLRTATGLPPEADAMPALFGCDAVRDDLYTAVGLAPHALALAHPVLARHLGWCLACRDRLVELEAVEALAAAVSPPRAVWSRIAGAAETVHAAAGRLVARVRDAAAGFAAVPEGFALGAALATPGPARGGVAAPEPAGPLYGSARVPLADSGLVAELAIEPEGGGRARLVVRVEGTPREPLSLRLQDAGDAGAVLARHTLHVGGPVAVGAVPPGSYLLDIVARREGRRFRFSLDLEPCV